MGRRNRESNPISQAFDVIVKMVSPSVFDPWPLYHRNKNKGIPNGDVADAIVEGFEDAIMRHSMESFDTFGSYCTRHCKGKIQELRRKYHGVYRGANKEYYKVKVREYVIDPAHFKLMPDSLTFVSPSRCSSIAPELIDADCRGILAQLIYKAIPKNDEIKKKIVEVLSLRYLSGCTWREVAEKMGMRSRQLAQHYGALGKQALLDYVETNEGSDVLRRIVGEFGAKYIYDEDAEYNQPSYVKEVDLVNTRLVVGDLLKAFEAD
ncbi:MAG: hypothetical protein GXY86_04940 [Firmicutes bacterium]|nr:hypothetical protein [Bacillota bacterium]